MDNLLPKPRNVMTLDLSLTGTACCCNGQTEVWRSKLRGHERLQFIISKLNDALATWDPEVVYVEGFSFGSKGQAVVDLGGLGWLVRHVLWAKGIPYVNVPPSSLKKYATGKGNANKNDMIAAAVRDFNFPGSDDNEADAWLMWHLAMEHRGTPAIKVNKEKAAAAQKVELIPAKVAS